MSPVPTTLPPSPNGALRVAIALLTRRPHCFEWWLRYHLALGVDHIFVHVEDTPELLPVLLSDEFADRVTVTSDPCGTGHELDDNYYSLMARQRRHVRHSLRACRVRAIDFLIHIDDDELLHFKTPFAALVRALPRNTPNIVLANIEARPTRLDAQNMFEECTRFSSALMLSYRNGKSAGRVSQGVDWNGPHRFTGRHHVVGLEDACVLHFESCRYEAWKQKFRQHTAGAVDEKKKQEIPFPFYRDSISLFQHDRDGGEDEERWKAFFMERKLGNTSALRDSQITRIHLTDSPAEMINGERGGGGVNPDSPAWQVAEQALASTLQHTRIGGRRPPSPAAEVGAGAERAASPPREKPREDRTSEEQDQEAQSGSCWRLGGLATIAAVLHRSWLKCLYKPGARNPARVR